MFVRPTGDESRRSFLLTGLAWTVLLAVPGLSGCALPLMMRAQPKKVSQEKFSCGEDCPPARKETRRTK
jgi:hypothetical protein